MACTRLILATILFPIHSMTIRSTAGALCKASGSKCHETFLEAVQHWSVEDINALDVNNKNPVHMAAWKGCFDNLRYLIEDLRCDVNVISTGQFNYGKTPIFYALTQSRDDVVLYLLQQGAHVKIVNNKGQSPLSIASSHLGDTAITAVRSAEAAQTEMPWVNYRSTHSDLLEYGDLDPRFMDRPQRTTDHVTQYAVNPTTRAIRKGNFRRNNPVQAKEMPQQRRHRQRPNSDPPQHQKGLTENEAELLDVTWSKLDTILMTSSVLDDPGTIAFADAMLTIIHLNVKRRKEWLSDTAQRLRDLRSTEDLLRLIRDITKQIGDDSTDGALLKRLELHLQDPDRRGRPTTAPRTRKWQTKGSVDESPWSDVLELVQHLRIANLQQNQQEECLSLTKSPIWVDALDALDDLSSFLADAPLVSIDTEWSHDKTLSTLQIAVDDDAWIVDILLDDAEYQRKCKTFIRSLMESERFILGFAIEHDLRKLEEFVDVRWQRRENCGTVLQPRVAGDVNPRICVLDVQNLFHSPTRDLPGLACCVAQLPSAGSKSLSKAMQCSDWTKRPLDSQQLEYAALDAVVLGYIVSEIGRHILPLRIGR